MTSAAARPVTGPRVMTAPNASARDGHGREGGGEHADAVRGQGEADAGRGEPEVTDRVRHVDRLQDEERRVEEDSRQ